MRKRLLWVTEEVPDPDLGGGSIRQYHLMRRLAEQVDIDVIVVGELRHAGLRPSLHRVVELPTLPPPAGPPKWLRRLDNLRMTGFGNQPFEVSSARPVREYLRDNLGDTSGYDIVQIEHEYFASLVPIHRANRWAITLHNLLSVRSRQQAAVSERGRVRWLFERDSARAERFERRIVADYDLVIAMSDEDAAALDGGAVVIPNGVDVDRFPLTPLPSQPRLYFSASFNWDPNVDGIVWFCERVFPLVRQQVPDAVLQLVGRHPNDRVRALLAQPGVVGNFDVPSVVPYLEAARVAIVPLRVGSGTRLKALEAMSAGRPVAGTTAGLEGLGLSDGEQAAIADDPHGLAARIVRLCRDDAHARQVAAGARSLVDKTFSWDRIGTAYTRHILSLAGPSGRSITGIRS
jgi:glycosyltransferase involved in cell wall biosynthesis